MKFLKTISHRALATGMAVVAGAVIAATSFVPPDQPLGHVAPSALNDASLESGNMVSYVPWFTFGNYHGDLIAAPVAADGSVSLLTPAWRAAEVMNDANNLDDKHWEEGRFIVTMHAEDGIPTPFIKDDLDGSQKDLLKPDEDKRIKYLRGDRSEEGNKFRTRESILGDIIHSNPVYVGAPKSGYPFSGYFPYAYSNRDRPARVYVGANDGMLHAFDAATGQETFAYVPSMLLGTLKDYAESSYSHRYYVDGTLTAEDAYFNSSWHTILVGGLSAGGKGLFALDVTSAAAITDESNEAWGAGSRVLWELTPQTLGASDLGYTYSRPSIAKMNDGKFAAVIGNGYLSTSGHASLMIIDAADGSVVRNIVAPDLDANGMSSPTLVDYDGDRVVDYAYAGDLNGNLWRFDLTSDFPGDWTVSYGGKPLLSIAPVAGVKRAIVTPPEVGVHPLGGLMVYVGPGRLLAAEDADDNGAHYMYGIRDTGYEDPDTLPVDETALLQQTLTQVAHAGTGDDVRTATNNQPNWGSHRGWRTSLQINGATTADMGERVLQPMSLRGGRLQFVSSNPTDGIGYNWLMQLDARTGGAPPHPIIDINEDGAFNTLDNADGNGDDEVTDVAEDRVVGEFQQQGLASSPVFAVIDDSGEAVMINHLSQINQLHEDEPPPSDEEDPGIVGGHFDLDVSSQTYAFDDGATDNHQHQWDDSYGTVIDYFDILGGFRSVDDTDGLPGSSSTKKFIISVANAHLSPAAIIEVNGIGFPVKEWRALAKRYLNGNLGTNEVYPVFKLGTTTPADDAAGVLQLTSLKITFPTNAIQVGGIHPSQTGCVKGNNSSPGGAYRNGALTLQLLDADDLVPGYEYDVATETWSITGGGSNKIHRLGYAVPVNGVHEIGDGMMFETTIFWHWGGSCYDIDAEEDWKADYLEEVGVDPDDLGMDEDIVGDPPPPPSDEGEGDPPEDRDESADHDVSRTRSSAGDNLGRLFWREVMPEL